MPHLIQVLSPTDACMCTSTWNKRARAILIIKMSVVVKPEVSLEEYIAHR